MLPHGHARADRRNLHLHRVALAKLQAEPGLAGRCVALLDRWLATPDHAPSRRWLEQWREILTEWEVERMADIVLDPEGRQTLRQCSPLGPLLTPQERWAALRDVNQTLGRLSP